jgi:type VI secretion system protein ImpE
MTAQDLYKAGRLSEAIEAALSEVKSKPTEVDRRYQLVVLLCYNGELDRADRQLEMLSTQHPESAMGVALLRQLIRAELCRREFHTAGRVPEFTDEPTELIKRHLKASICLREGAAIEAADLLAETEAERPRMVGVCDGQPFEDLRDLDDLLAPVFEVLTSSGKYYWIPIGEVNRLEMAPPQSLSELLWRPVRLTLLNEPPGAVYMPMLYSGSDRDEQEEIRLGRATQWLGGDGTPVRGRGLRMLMIGDQACPILDIEHLEMKPLDGQETQEHVNDG